MLGLNQDIDMHYAEEKIWSFVNWIITLNCNVNNKPGFGKAPHKPILLLSLIDRMEKLSLQENKFPIDDALFEYFERNWLLLVNTKHKRDVTVPLFHLQNDNQVWEVIDIRGQNLPNTWGKKRLREEIEYGKFDRDFFDLLLHPDTRNLFRTVLVDHYFPDTKENYLANRPQMNFLREIELEILEDAPVHYGRQSPERYGPLRHWKFRYNILRIYDATCCISGLHVDDYDLLIDAAHIKPFRQFKDNSIRNGLALSPTPVPTFFPSQNHSS